MTQTYGQNWQDINQNALKTLGTAASTTNATIMDRIQTEFESPLRPHATFPTPDGKINFTISPTASADGASRSIPALKSVVNAVAQSTLDFQSNTHATTGATFIMTWPTSNTLNYYRRVGFTLDYSGQINVMFSPEYALKASLPNIGTVLNKKFLAIGWIDVQCTDVTNNLFKSADESTSIITNTTIGRFGSGGGAGGGGLDTYALISDAQAEANGTDNDIAFVVETESFYRYEATGYSSTTADSKWIISVTSDANARWVAVGGKYNYTVPGEVFTTIANMKAWLNGLDNFLAYCVETETYYRYEATSLSGVTGDDKWIVAVTADANARWKAVAGKYIYELPGYVFSTVASMKALVTGQDNMLAYCVETESWYRYVTSSLTGDDTNIVVVTSDATKRWKAVAGKYVYELLGTNFATLAAMKALVNGQLGAVVYCVETETWYQYVTSSVTADDKAIVSVTADATKRWKAISGKYLYEVPGSTYALVADIKAVTTGQDNILAYCVATETYYRYESSSTLIADDAFVISVTSDANARWIGVAGKYTMNSVSTGNTQVWDSFQDVLMQLPYSFLDGNVFDLDGQTKTDLGNTTGTYMDNKKAYQLNATQIFQSSDMLGIEFKAELRELAEVFVRVVYDISFMDATPTVQLSRNGGVEWQTVTMSRVGTTDALSGRLLFAAEAADITLPENYTSGSDTTKKLTNTGSGTKYSQPFTTSQYEQVNSIVAYVNKTGTPSGNLYISLYTDNSGSPGTLLNSFPTVYIPGLSSGANTLTLTSSVVLATGTKYHVVYETDDSYKATYVASTHEIAPVTDSAGDGTFMVYNTSWSAVASYKAKLTLKGRPQDLRVKITSSTAGSLLKGVGLYTGPEAGGSASYKLVQKYTVDSSANTYTFLVTKWYPDADLTKVYCAETGQVFVYPAFTLAGTTGGVNVVFPSGTFYSLPATTYNITIMQTDGTTYDSSDANGLMLTDNHLGSYNTSLDRSIAGRGIYLRNAAGTLRELALDASDNIIIKSVP